MILQILSLVALAGDHSNLHPQDADLFVCAPDLQGAITASEGVALRRLLKDPDIVKLLGDDLELPGMLSAVGGAADLPEDALNILWESASAASLSVAGLDEFETAPDLRNAGPEEFIEILLEHELMAVMEFNSPEDAKALMALSGAVSSGLVLAGETTHETAAGTARVTDYEATPGDSQRSIWTAQWGSYIAVGLGATGAPGLVERLGGGGSLADTDHWGRGAGAMKEEGGAHYLIYHHNLIGDPWYGLSAGEIGLPMPDLSLSVVELFFGGVLPLGASEKHGSCRIVDGEYVFETMDLRAKAGEGSKPLADDFLNLVNPEAVGVWATAMDPEVVAATGHELISTLIDIPAEVIATELKYAVGASLQDLLAPLGDGVAFYMLPISGATIPRFHAVVELEDSAKYLEAWTMFAEFLKFQGAEFVEVEDRAYRKIPVFSLKQVGSAEASVGGSGPLASLNSMGVMSPAFTVAILPDRAVFGISSSYVKREVRRLLKEEDEAGVHPLAESGPPCPAGVSYFGHLNWPEVLGGIYDTVTAFLPLLADSGAMPFDVDALPETETITQYFSPTYVWSRPGDSGTYTLKRSPVGFETGLGLVGIAGAAAFGVQTFGSEASLERSTPFKASTDDHPTPEPEEVVPAPPADLEQQIETRARLQEVKLGLVIYKSDKGNFPSALSELLVPTQAYPKGFLNSDTLPADGWGNALHYKAEPGGSGYQLWSAGADGVSNGGEGDDVPAR